MASINKTPNYGLNQWQGNEYPKRQDFVDDNLKIDTEIKEVDIKVGPLASLGTTIKTSIVNAINSLLAALESHKADVATQLNLKANKVQENWQDAIILNGWQGPIQYFKDNFGIVHLRGSLSAGLTDVGTNILQLPTGYRTSLDIIGLITTEGTGVPMRGQGVLIGADGYIQIYSEASLNYIQFNLSFKAGV